MEVKKEPRDLYENTHVYEKCIFCNNATDTWYEPLNVPVCLSCGKTKTEEDTTNRINEIDYFEENGKDN